MSLKYGWSKILEVVGLFLGSHDKQALINYWASYGALGITSSIYIPENYLKL